MAVICVRAERRVYNSSCQTEVLTSESCQCSKYCSPVTYEKEYVKKNTLKT